MVDAAALDEIRGMSDRTAAARRALELKRSWYHVLDLPGGLTTPGFADLRHVVRELLPGSLDGKRCLDVGTFDGLYAFEMERRGAADVVAIDVPDPAQLDHPPMHREANLAYAAETGALPGDGFKTAAAVLDSHARWVGCNVYDLSPDVIGGHVDFAVVSTLLQHLRDPVRALERLRECLKPGAEAVILETFLPSLSLWHRKQPLLQFRGAWPDNHFTWMVPNIAALRAWPTSAGLEVLPGRTRWWNLRSHSLIRRGDYLAAIKVRRQP
jgi:tRNA (mo5U34)-methyltransferase